MNKLPDNFEYDVALSFAGEDRTYVKEVALAMRRKRLRVFYYEFEEADLLAKNLHDYLTDLYTNKAKLCLIFISKAYRDKSWTNLERQAAFSRALRDKNEYVIPVKIDDIEIPGLLSTIAYTSNKSPEALAQLIADKLFLTQTIATVLDSLEGKRDRLILSFSGLFELDDKRFENSLQFFSHWSSNYLSSVPIELLLPSLIQDWLEYCENFKEENAWRKIPNETQEMFNKFLADIHSIDLPLIMNGVRRIIGSFTLDQKDLTCRVVKKYVELKIVCLLRALSSFRLIGMKDPEWLHQQRNLAELWGQNIMNGLSYICFLDNSEPNFWLDADIYDDVTTVNWKKYRIFIPSTLILKNKLRPIDKESFLEFIVPQLVENEDWSHLLSTFSKYPDRLKVTLRAENLFSTDHFENISTFGGGSERIIPSLHKARNYINFITKDLPAESQERERSVLESRLWAISNISDKWIDSSI